MRLATYLFICVDLSLALFEAPALFPLPFVATALAEVICLAAFSARLVHFAKVTAQMVFWKDTKNICIMVTIVVTLIDLIVYGSLEAFHVHSVRWTRALRPVFLINFPESRQVRSQVTFCLPRSAGGLKTAEGAPYFTNILEIAFELYVLVTTANNPDVMMPAYNFNWWYSLYFITYIIINTYIFMSVFLAVVYNNYRKHLKNEIRKLAYLKRHKMIEAFDILKVKVGTEFVVKEATWKQLAKAVAPDISSSHLELLLRISDEGQQGFVDKTNFLRLADLLNIQVVTVNLRRHPLEAWVPRVYQCSLSLLVQRVVRHRAFVWAYDVIILINAIFIALDEKHPFISYAEWLFLALYIVEILLKLYTYEPRAYFGRKQFWNWFDTLIIIAALVATVANATVQSARKYNSRQILDIVLILRILRLLRVIISIERFRVIVTTLINIGPTMLTFGGLVFVVYYAFAVIGMEMFHGKIQFFDPNSTSPDALVCGNPALKGSAFARDRYCKNNFNDLASSFVVLMELTVVNQCLPLLAGGFALVTHQAAKLYFILFHIVVVILIVNIFIAFILEAFFVAYSLGKSEIETAIEKKIQELGVGIQEEDVEDWKLIRNTGARDSAFSGSDGDHRIKASEGLYFRIASKKYRTVDALLQRMFESEIASSDEGPSLEEILNFSPSDIYPKNPNFENSA
uniref:Ion transport domain-containing protein n=1 Tax=Cavia porcellus TaxID=10141 RepID=A0A286XHN7_CAVPO